MAELKTKQTEESVESFLNSIADQQKRSDAHKICHIMSEVTGEPAKMWGPSIVGFGTYTYKYASGREGEWPVVGFSPRKQNLTLYITEDFDAYAPLMHRLGTYSTGKSCLYIKRLSDIDIDVLAKLIQAAYNALKEKDFRLDFSK